jgi:hypothetical protein
MEGFTMEPTQGKPIRKRRRWLIVAFVLVLVSLGTWWYWPRGDARFVGKWLVLSPHPNSGREVRFLTNGQYEELVSGARVTVLDFQVKGDELCLRPQLSEAFARGVSIGVETLLQRLRNEVPTMRLPFRFSTADDLMLEYGTTDEIADNLHLTRIPE